MTFTELKLQCAIYQMRKHLGSRDYVTSDSRMAMAVIVRDAYTRLIGDVLFPFTIDDVSRAYMRHRKGKQTKACASTALIHQQFNCFWENRGKGPCSDEVHFGHIVANSIGGEATSQNGLIECSRHNCSRGILTIEEYMSKGSEVSA
jgi:hypothetical protein